MKAITGDNRYVEILADYEREEPVSMCEVLDKIELKGIEKGENNINNLYAHLKDIGRMDDVLKAFSDEEFRDQLKREFAGKY